MNAARSARPLDYGEGVVWWQSVHITDFQVAYKSLTRYPYIVYNYPPVYHVVSLWAAKLSGNWLKSARLLSLFSAFGAVFVLALLVFLSLPKRAPPLYRMAAALFGPCLALSCDGMSFARLARVDALGVFFSIAGIAAFISARRRPAGQFLAFALFVLALFTKQTLMAAPAACLVAAALLRPIRAGMLALFAVICAAIPLAYLESRTHGGFLLNNVLYNIHPFSPGLAISAWTRNFVQILPLGALAIAQIAVLQSRATLPRIRVMLERSLYYRAAVILSLAFIFAAVQSLSAGKAGSNANYFMELNFIAGALAGLFLFRVLAGAQLRPGGASTAIYVLTLGAAICAIPPAIAPLSPQYRAMNRGAVETYRRALEAVHNIRGPVYSEEMTLLMNSGKEVPAEHSSITSLARTGRWDETPFVNMILERRFAAIVITNFDLPERYSPRVKQAIEQAYEPEKIIGPYVFWRPRR